MRHRQPHTFQQAASATSPMRDMPSLMIVGTDNGIQQILMGRLLLLLLLTSSLLLLLLLLSGS